MANNIQTIFPIGAHFCTPQASRNDDNNLPDATLNEQHSSPWSGLRNRRLLENSTVDFDQPSAKYGAIGSGPLKPAIPAQTMKFAKGPIIYIGTNDNIWAPSTSTGESSASSSSSSSSRVTFAPAPPLPPRLSPEQRAHFKARARAMVDGEASTAIKMMLAFALYEYCATRVFQLLLAEGMEDGELGDDDRTDGQVTEEEWEMDEEWGDDEETDGELGDDEETDGESGDDEDTDGELGDDEETDGEAEEDWEMV